MSDPYRTAPSKVFSDPDHGIWFLLDQVSGVVKFKSKSESSIKVFLKSGQDAAVSWPGVLEEASKVYDAIVDALEEFHR